MCRPRETTMELLTNAQYGSPLDVPTTPYQLRRNGGRVASRVASDRRPTP